MKNILIITLGTREIQFMQKDLNLNNFEIEGKLLINRNSKEISFPITENDNFREYIFPNLARSAGKIIKENYPVFKNIIKLPLISNALNEIVNENEKVDEIILVYTDQQELEDEHWGKKKDTLYYKDVIKKHISEVLQPNQTFVYKEIGVFEDVTDYDKKYKEFAVKCKNLFEDKDVINKIYLLPQGGIDQINHSLTLQLIQAFGDKVIIWQQAEAEKPKELKFPFLFINDLNKQKIIKHAQDYDFGLICNITKDGYNEDIFKLAHFANRKLNLYYDGLDKTNKYYEEKTDENKACDLYIYAKMFYNKGDYGNYLWRLFTLLENIHRIRVDKVFGNTEDLFLEARKHPEDNLWIDIIKKHEELEELLEKKLKQKKLPAWRVPNRFAYRYIYKFLIQTGEIREDTEMQNFLEYIFKKSALLLDKRNDLAHYLRPITKEIIEAILKNVSIDDINEKCDFVFKLSKDKPFGIYDDIKKDILALL